MKKESRSYNFGKGEEDAQKAEAGQSIEDERTERKKFRTIQGVRFEEGIPQEEIDSFLRSYDRELLRHEKEDDLTYLEHRSIGGTAVNTLHPLKPYSLLSGHRTGQELSQGRKRSAKIYGSCAIDRNTRRIIIGGNKGQSINLDIGDEAKEQFTQCIERLKREQQSDPIRVFCFFNEPNVDPETGTIVLPTLKEMKDPKTDEILLSGDSASKIRLRERLMFEGSGIVAFIDQEGWRIEKRR